MGPSCCRDTAGFRARGAEDHVTLVTSTAKSAPSRVRVSLAVLPATALGLLLWPLGTLVSLGPRLPARPGPPSSWLLPLRRSSASVASSLLALLPRVCLLPCVSHQDTRGFRVHGSSGCPPCRALVCLPGPHVCAVPLG